MRMVDIIEKKRNGEALTNDELDYFVSGVTDGSLPDYQISALLMAIYFRGMTEEETIALTKLMSRSGECADLDALGPQTADKHSTGGVGDKTTLIAAPIAAAVGVKIAKMSGRGLGFTGGTVDKLQSIPNYKVRLNPKEFIKIVQKTGLSVVGQTGNFAPADKKLYALRDVTATVESLPLIASSIMSKKLAAGAKSIVLDVKYGSGAFMHDRKKAEALAEIMVKIGNACGRKTTAYITNMDAPLGFCVGNTLEVAEAAEVLKGKNVPDLKVLSLSLAAGMASLSLGIPRDRAKALCADALCGGRAYNKFLEWIAAQGGDISVFNDLESFTKAKYSARLCADRDGYIERLDALTVGHVSALLGAGRARIEDEVDLTAGIRLFKKPGDDVKKGDALAELQSGTVKDFRDALKMLSRAFKFSDKKPKLPPIIYSVI